MTALRKVLIIFCVSLTQYTSAQVLAPGNVVILGWNSDDAFPNQRWAFMSLINLPAGTIINFTDAGYDATASQFNINSANEGHMRYTLPSPLAAGQVVFATNQTINGSTTGVTGQLGGTTFGFSPAGDQIIVYQGTLGTAVGATFIYAVNTGTGVLYGSNGTWLPPGSGPLPGDQFSYIPPGLTSTTAVALTSNVGNTSSGPGTIGTNNYGFDNMYYGGPNSGTQSQMLSNLANPANWAGDNTTSWNIASGGVFGAGTFTIVPVTLVSYEVSLQQNGSVKVQWRTGTETSNSHFEIERSRDGITFISIGKVAGKGNSVVPVDYLFVDDRPSGGWNYYRLKQVDIDGRSKLFQIKAVNISIRSLRITPNPAITHLWIEIPDEAYQRINIVSAGGQLIKSISLQQNQSVLRVDVTALVNGLHYLQFLKKDGSRVTRTFVKGK